MAGLPRLDATAEVAESPFRHLVFPEGTLLSEVDGERLAATFPAEGVVTERRRLEGSDKTYAVRTASVHTFGRWSPVLDRLDPAWRELVTWLVDSDYRAALADLLGIPPQRVELELRITEYPCGGWMSRHTDRPDKLFSQNVYFCPDWRPEWGGGLALYDGEHTPEPAAVVAPGLGTSVAFARSDVSWHEVMPVSEAAAGPRRALLIHGHRSENPEER